MSKRVGGSRRGSRSRLRKGLRSRSKISITRYFQEFKEGEKVVLKAEPAVQKGMYDSRHHGRQGIVHKKRGKCYEVLVKDIGKQKRLIVHPVHLKKA